MTIGIHAHGDILGRHGRGLALALAAAFLWGTLPLALKRIMSNVDAVSIVWLRFCVAAAWLWLMAPNRSRMPDRAEIGALALAAVALGANFVLYNISLNYMNPTACQIMAQCGPMLLLLGGTLLYREKLYPLQMAGIAVLLAGFALFFNRRLALLLTDSQGMGVLLGFAAALVWAIYGLAQKKLLATMTATQILRLVYTFCAIALTPLASPENFLTLNPGQYACLAYCCANTILAYGAFTTALGFWHTAGVGAIVTLPPIFTLVCAWLAHLTLPAFFPAENLTFLSCLGAIVVVLGAMTIALGPLLSQEKKSV